MTNHKAVCRLKVGQGPVLKSVMFRGRKAARQLPLQAVLQSPSPIHVALKQKGPDSDTPMGACHSRGGEVRAGSAPDGIVIVARPSPRIVDFVNYIVQSIV